MKEIQKNTPAQAAGFAAVTGKLPALNSKNLNRLSVFLVQGNTILSEAPVTPSGSFQFHVAPHLASESGVFAVLGPKGLDSQSLASHTDLPRIALSSVKRHERGGISLDFAHLKISDELINPWWIWCREYTVSGTLETATGCPMGAQVTVYNVTSGVSGLVETPIVTVPTDVNGNFTATFNWCSRLCWWPCWPIWWQCWPWWWELDILAVIENVERGLQVQSAGTATIKSSRIAPMRQPSGADLMTGVGFAASRAGAQLQPDNTRTALIASKFADARIREIFPWWWWCCDNPNIVFSATQGATTVLNEDPNTSTRWCFPSGQTVSLTGNSQSLGACPVTQTGDNAFAWTSVGGEPPYWALVENISMGYADGTPGSAASNMAFAGSLNLNGAFSGDLAFYQVLAGQWGGSNPNPARGGSAPVTSQPVSLPTKLVNYVSIWRDATKTVEVDAVVLGPCSFNGHDNLYMTPSQRPNAPAAVSAQIGNFPTVALPDFVIGWAAPDLVLTVPAADLISPAVAGGVSLSVNPFDITGNPPATFDSGDPLTLMIDTTGLSAATIDWVAVYNADGTPALKTAASSTACPAYQITTPGGGYVLLHATVSDDPNGHLYEYQIQTQYGDGLYLWATPYDRDYAQAPSSFTSPSGTQLYGVDAGYEKPNNLPLPPPAPSLPPYLAAAPSNWFFGGGGDTFQLTITESCCYDFQLWVGKRVTDGQTFVCTWGNPTFQTVNITVSPSGS